MAKMYADEQFPLPSVKILRNLGHDILTVQEAGNVGDSDPDVLTFAIVSDRAVLTQNRRDFLKLHRSQPDHAGIIICSEDRNFVRLAEQVHNAISEESTLSGKLIRVVKPEI